MGSLDGPEPGPGTGTRTAGTGTRTGTGPRIAVLADDLTSAGDGAAPFRRTGHTARILFSVPDEPVRDPGVTAVDLGSRLLDEAAAVARTLRAARLCADADLVLKTVDSTLRGHVAAEVRAAWEGSRRRAVVIAPAFPAEGRVTVDGVQYVRGVPVHESAYARDPVHPVRCSDLAALFPGATVVGPEGTAGLPGLLAEGRPVVCSARGDADLDRFVAAVPHPGDVLWVGSPGLAAALARRYPLVPGVTIPAPRPARRPLVAVGSVNPVTRRQLAVLRARADVRGLTVGDGDRAASEEALRGLDAPVLTLQTPDGRRTPEQARTLARSLAVLSRALTEQGLVDALVVTGGETAATVLETLGVIGIDLLDEPEPGVARGTPIGGPALPVLIKAGGFGDDDLLVRLCRLVRQHPATEETPA
ncbi:four-carbon acid sugar kinase family protein [Streptomyces sp. KL118A]|uniref:four-carbon acid sugar kinase family protein n=1 Tax=Streptomyces sp. KL118A TaxID=3045153 RepID=UPI00278BE0F1|nr:four-carbon acid sugar kinase family protein [Streptomyces sp. KL118A]